MVSITLIRQEHIMSMHRMLWCALCFLGTIGCAVKQDIFLQDAESRAAVSQLPVFVSSPNQAGRIAVSGRVHVDPAGTVEALARGHSPVNAAGIYQLDTVRNGNDVVFKETSGANVYKFGGKNFRWTPSRVMAGFDLQYFPSDRSALTLGIDYASGASRAAWGGHLGFGLIRMGERSALRLDGGIQWRKVDVSALTAVRTDVYSIFGNSTDNVMLYYDEIEQTNLDFYGGITWNAVNDDRIANLFLSLFISRQTLMDIQPRSAALMFPLYTTIAVNDARADITSTNVILTPGVIITLDEDQRLIIGARMTNCWVGESEEVVSRWAPFIQLEAVF